MKLKSLEEQLSAPVHRTTVAKLIVVPAKEEGKTPRLTMSGTKGSQVSKGADSKRDNGQPRSPPGAASARAGAGTRKGEGTGQTAESKSPAAGSSAGLSATVQVGAGPSGAGGELTAVAEQGEFLNGAADESHAAGSRAPGVPPQHAPAAALRDSSASPLGSQNGGVAGESAASEGSAPGTPSLSRLASTTRKLPLEPLAGAGPGSLSRGGTSPVISSGPRFGKPPLPATSGIGAPRSALPPLGALPSSDDAGANGNEASAAEDDSKAGLDSKRKQASRSPIDGAAQQISPRLQQKPVLGKRKTAEQDAPVLAAAAAQAKPGSSVDAKDEKGPAQAPAGAPSLTASMRVKSKVGSPTGADSAPAAAAAAGPASPAAAERSPASAATSAAAAASGTDSPGSPAGGPAAVAAAAQPPGVASLRAISSVRGAAAAAVSAGVSVSGAPGSRPSSASREPGKQQPASAGPGTGDEKSKDGLGSVRAKKAGQPELARAVSGSTAAAAAAASSPASPAAPAPGPGTAPGDAKSSEPSKPAEAQPSKPSEPSEQGDAAASTGKAEATDKDKDKDDARQRKLQPQPSSSYMTSDDEQTPRGDAVKDDAKRRDDQQQPPKSGTPVPTASEEPLDFRNLSNRRKQAGGRKKSSVEMRWDWEEKEEADKATKERQRRGEVLRCTD